MRKGLFKWRVEKLAREKRFLIAFLSVIYGMRRESENRIAKPLTREFSKKEKTTREVYLSSKR